MGGNSIQQTTDGGYIVAGGIYNNIHGDSLVNDYWIVKLSSTGLIEWQESLGGSKNEIATSIQQATDGGYIVAGNSDSNDGDVTGNHGDRDYWIVKLASSGSIEWQISLGGSGDDYAYSIQQTNDGGYIVAGTSNSPNDGDVTGNHGGFDYWIVKLKPDYSLCIDAPGFEIANVPIKAEIALTGANIVAMDSAVFSLNYNPIAMMFQGITSSICQSSTYRFRQRFACHIAKLHVSISGNALHCNISAASIIRRYNVHTIYYRQHTSVSSFGFDYCASMHYASNPPPFVRVGGCVVQ